MGIRSVNHDTTPCPPPDPCDPKSGEYASVNARIPSDPPIPRPVQGIEKELRERLASVRCPEHDQVALVEVSFADNGAMQIVPIGCCDQLDRLTVVALQGFVTMPPPGALDRPIPHPSR